jgi:hypothetical protein
VERKTENTLFPTLTLLFGEINVDSITLCRTYFQIVEPTLISLNKRVSVRECLKESVLNTHFVME